MWRDITYQHARFLLLVHSYSSMSIYIDMINAFTKQFMIIIFKVYCDINKIKIAWFPFVVYSCYIFYRSVESLGYLNNMKIDFLHARPWWEIVIHGCYSLVKIAFAPICTCKNNWRIWRHNASISGLRDVTDQLWWRHNAKSETAVLGEMSDRWWFLAECVFQDIK